MLKIENGDLEDNAAVRVVKHENVVVEFAAAARVIQSAVGLNRYAAGDALLTGSKQMSCDFMVELSPGRDVLQGVAGDWLVQHAPGDHGIVAAARFDSVYRVRTGS